MSELINGDGLVKYKLPKIFEIAATVYWPYIFLSGGRGSGKSYFAAFFFLSKALTEKCRIWCAREIQNTIADSTHRLLCEMIETLGLSSLFKITENSIVCNLTGSDFLFQGLRDQDVEKIKSKQSVKYVWIEEAQSITQNSLDILIPTIIRNEGFQIVFTYNPKYEDDPVHKMALSGREDYLHIHSTYLDNKYVAQSLVKEAEMCKVNDPAYYNQHWLGQCVGHGGVIYSMYDPDWHVAPIDLMSDEFRRANYFMFIDPHPQHYPAISWWALTSYNILHCYNEFPYYGPAFNNRYYEELRNDTLPKDWNISKLCDIIKSMDGTEFGVMKVRRVIDPRYISVADKGNSLSPTLGIIQLFAQNGISGFEIPPHMMIEPMRESLKQLLQTYNQMSTKSVYNTPQIQIAPWCKNMDRALQRHRMDEKDKYEDETFKDFIDGLRYGLAILGGEIKWVDNIRKEIDTEHYVDPYQTSSFTSSNTAMR